MTGSIAIAVGILALFALAAVYCWIDLRDLIDRVAHEEELDELWNDEPDAVVLLLLGEAS
jgi:hypothetical protein